MTFVEFLRWVAIGYALGSFTVAAAFLARLSADVRALREVFERSELAADTYRRNTPPGVIGAIQARGASLEPHSEQPNALEDPFR